MTVHGNQYLLPLFIRKGAHPLSIQGNDELALAFYLLSKDLEKNKKILSFSRLLWPILSIQGVISTHIMLDGLNLFRKIGRFSNPPRQPLIGHILRNIDNRSQIEQLNILYDILTYKDKDALEIGEGEESEFHTLKIDGLINPEFLQTLFSIIPLIEYKPIADYTVLDASISTEHALNISEEYRQIINTMKGNSLRWKTQIELINKEVSKWLIDLNVQLKDIDSRYSSQISKTTTSIDTYQVDEQIKLEQDKIDQWNVNEKKRIVENMSTLFKTFERHLEEMIKKNKFFTSDDSLKSRVFEDLMPHFENQFNYLTDEGNKFLETLIALKQKFHELKARASQIDIEANQKLEQFKNSLESKLKDRDRQLTEFESEKQVKISELQNLKEQIEIRFEKIMDIIELKQNTCLQESQTLTGWSLNDNQSDLFSRPIQWIYMPVYAMFIEDEDNMEEYMNIVFPGYITNDPNNLYEDISDTFINLKDLLKDRIENDMAIRSNFEFSCERKNLLKDPSLNKRIQIGISKLREKFLLNESAENIIREKLNLIS
ncbi:MAG: coiled-coil domain-containing protein [Candidatus Hodarchaeota archaeon]